MLEAGVRLGNPAASPWYSSNYEQTDAVKKPLVGVAKRSLSINC